MNWLHMEIDAPRCLLPPSQAALKVRPKQLYGVNRGTFASVLLTTDALPGGRADGEPLFDIGAPDYTAENRFSTLVAIPFRDLPERGRQELEAIIAPKVKLALGFEQRGWPTPAFLARAVTMARGRDAVAGSESSSVASLAAEARPPGRPQKPAWPRIVQLVRQLASAGVMANRAEGARPPETRAISACQGASDGLPHDEYRQPMTRSDQLCGPRRRACVSRDTSQAQSGCVTRHLGVAC